MIRREMKQIEDKIKVFLDENEACQRLAEIPGIGIMTATALVATVAMRGNFEVAGIWRHFSGWCPDSTPLAERRSFWDLETR